MSVNKIDKRNYTIEDLEEILQAKEDLIDHLKCRENYMNVPF